MGGAAVVIAEMLPGGVVTHFTVTATDSANNAAIATCYLPTYDVSLPEGRVTSEFQATSRHDILRASAVVYDDSELKSQKEGVGFGYGIFSDQIVPWTDVHVGGKFASVADQNDPLTEFTRERLGRLILSPFEVASYSRVSDCASHCLNVISTTCLSFNYDFGTSGTCEILLGIEGSAAELHESGRFHYYERLGVGHSLEFYHDDLLLRHGDVYYMQLQVQNDLGYENIISSEPIIADFSPPNPGIIENELIDQISNEPCLNFVPDEWQFRCVETTELANYRIIVDGEGSACVFNGHTPYVDLLYTRANTYVSANWDGFHDDETGIYGYTWTIGTEPCLDDIHPHKDPHAHFFDESEWTHIGLADSFEEELADGKYHVSVRAINKVDFGGPMATTVCHSISYTIDRSPPIVHEVTVLGYDEDDCIITATYNLSDDLSHIREISFGLGKSPRDVYLLDWKRESNITHIAYPFCVPDGVPTWVKIRAMNHVELTTVGHAESPIIVDTSPPIPGEVFDGTVLDHDIDYQSSSDELCVSWKGFYDEESGIEKYVWYAGVTPGSNDTIESIELSHSEFRACKSGVELKHNERYYSTIVAFNAGHKKLSTAVTTDGVLVDTTPPVEGWIIDGLQREYDMIYSPVATTVSASWDDFADPESNIKEYLARIWRKKQGKGNPSQAENIYSRGSLPAETNSINWHHFHLHHGDYVYTEIEAVNKALTGTKVASTGFTVDLTEPIFNFIGDGDTLGVDRSYTESLTQLAANWDCEDNESGVDHYKVTVYQTYGGSRRQFYPNDGESHEIVDSDTVVWHSPSTLNLYNGGYYSIRVSAVNGAGLGSVRDTSGVIVDSTPPQMLQISIGVLTADEEEELIDGYVMQTDTEGIRAYWEAVDFESGIFAYWIAVGTSGGATDVQDFTKYDPTNGGYIDGLILKKYSDEENPGTLYFVTCKAENSAGTISEALVSSAIKVVSADKVGFVTDGPEIETNYEVEQMAVDIDYQKEIGTVTAQFTGFESEQHGIVHYEWAVGTTPRSDDVQPYISDGIVTDDQGYHIGEGISSLGAAQSLLSLVHGKQYFATIRAITGAGNVLDSSSDGFTVDVTAPQISIDNFDGRNESDLALDSTKYQKSEHTIESSWTISEEESEILHTEFCYGSFPGSSDIFNCTDTTGIDQTPTSMVEPNVQGLPNILTLRTTNQVGLTAETHSDGITVDTTPPTPGNISCPPSIRTTDDLICSWNNFNDKESGIAHYQVALGFAEGDDAVYPFTVVDSSFHEYKFNGPFLDVEHYLTLIVTNNAGGETRSYSDPVYVDDTPPIPGSVVHLDGVDEVDYSGSPSVKCDALKDNDCATNDAVCQKSVDRLFVAWEGFDDPESIVTRYQVAVGTNRGTTDILDFVDVDVSLGNFAFIDGVDLYDVRQAFVSVRGYNLAGMHTTAVSNGVYISRVSAGLAPLEGTYIWDGRQDSDVDFQDSNEMLEAQWSFQGDPCPKIHYEWAIFRFDGLRMQNFTTTTDDFGMNDGLDMKNEESYYSVVKASNLLGYTEVIRSDGITIQLEPLLPRDQNFHETDEGGTDGENEDLFDIHPWTNVGKDTMVEATGLSLADKETYRAVVMATDESGFCSLALADFTVDLTPPVPGHIRVGPFTDEAVTYITRGDLLPVAWSNFYDDESGLDKYSLSLHDGLSCDGKTDPVLLIDFIDVPANDTSYTFVDLDLETNRPYYVHLRVTNTAGLSTTVVSQPVFVDLTDPTAGVVKDTDDFRVDNDYQSSKTSLDGFFLHLPTSEGAACPSRVVSDDFTADGGWFAVNSQGVWGTKYEDTVMFTPNQNTEDTEYETHTVLIEKT
ncbi:uncharacterized protein [Ptychodera flava]|uniref:uncharacterized protein n=1 Tax=Ptychodera flava TaxID=63121 RepID=UPI00396A7E3F